MKKMKMFLLLAVVISLLSSCGGAANIPPNTSQPPESDTEENISVAETHNELENIESNSQTDFSRITITIGDTKITAELDDSEIARQFIALLPQTITMSRGRDREYYGRIDGTLQYDEGDIQTFAEDGDLAYWFSGNSLAFFFNTENDSAVNSGIVVFGSITSDLSVFDDMGGSETMTVTLAE